MFAGFDEDAKKRHHTALQEQLVKQSLAYRDACFAYDDLLPPNSPASY